MSIKSLKIQRNGAHSYVTETVAIDSTGDLIEVDTGGETLVSLNIEGDATADYSLDVGPDGETYFEDEETYSGTEVRDAFVLGDRYLKIRLTTAASAGDEATITIQEAR